MNLLECKNLSVSYDGKTVVNNASFTLNPGDYLYVIGENGSGKSTLVKTLLSLKKPDAGDIIYGGQLKRNEIGYLPQRIEIQNDFPASVQEIVMLGCLGKRGLKPFYGHKERQLAAEKMELLEISDLRHKSYKELSGGQQQRVLLARALCATKTLLVLDEPVAGLDPLITEQLYSTIEQINKSGIAVIMVSHDIQSAVQYGSHILHIKNKPMFFGTVQDYLESDVGKEYLGGRRYVGGCC